MKNIEQLGEVINTDVLVIGGSIAGVPAAIKAKEKGADVLVVDKCGIGWGGQVPITGGHWAFPYPGREDEYFKWYVEQGEYLNNQDWSYTFAHDNYKVAKEMFDEWRLPVYRINGDFVTNRAHRDFAGGQYQASRFMIKLKQVAVSRGIKTLDKTYICHLLQHDGKVVGAVGFGLVDGKTYIFKAKATIIACGHAHTQRDRRFTVNWGEGQLMAYRAGAQLMNAEFGGSSANPNTLALGEIYRRGPYYVFFENALGERFMGRYYPELMGGLKMGGERQDFHKISDSMLREVEAGRGPIYINFGKLTPEEMEVALRRQALAPPEFQAAGGRGDMMRYILKHTGHDPLKEKLEVAPCVNGFFGGAIRVDLDCQTTVEGLWAIGDACNQGSSRTGAKVAGFVPGHGVSWAAVTGFRAGTSAGEHVATSGQVKVDYEEVKKAKERVVAPLDRAGTVAAHEVVYQIQEVTVPLKYALRREARLLKEALGKLDIARQNLRKVGAKDHHELSRYHQAEGLFYSVELAFKASLMRKESRGDFMRVDYPNRDDKNWLEWITIQQEEGKDKFSIEPVPIERYRLKPPQA